MNLYDFDPEKVCLLDGYALVRDCFPKIDLNNFEACQDAWELIKREVVFNPLAQMGQSDAVYWLKISSKKGHEKSSLTKTIQTKWALSILTPSGKIFEVVKKSNIVGSFWFEDELFAEFADGLIVRVEPSLDRRFLVKHIEVKQVDGLDYFESLDVVV